MSYYADEYARQRARVRNLSPEERQYINSKVDIIAKEIPTLKSMCKQYCSLDTYSAILTERELLRETRNRIERKFQELRRDYDWYHLMFRKIERGMNKLGVLDDFLVLCMYCKVYGLNPADYSRNFDTVDLSDVICSIAYSKSFNKPYVPILNYVETFYAPQRHTLGWIRTDTWRYEVLRQGRLTKQEIDAIPTHNDYILTVVTAMLAWNKDDCYFQLSLTEEEMMSLYIEYFRAEYLKFEHKYLIHLVSGKHDIVELCKLMAEVRGVVSKLHLFCN